GEILAASSAAGEIVLWENNQLITLQKATNQAVNCLAFSHDGKYLAIGGQDGKVKIWCENQLITTLENAPVWVDQLAWSYTNNHLAFSLGRYVQIWDADTLEVVVILNFNDSSILGIDWRKDDKYLAING
ncbi:MAG: WD40 repeat domain-containing protein, partial [Dolichospermum sp.]